MAMTATIALSPSSTVLTEQKLTASVTVSNSGASAVNITGIQGNAIATGATAATYNSGVSIGTVNTGPNAILSVPAGGTLVKTFDLRFHGPQSGSLTSGSFSDGFSVSALCSSDDGSVFSPTAATITVNSAVSFPAAQQ